MSWLDYDVSVVPISSAELYEHRDKDRLFAAIAVGLEGSGALHMLHDIAIELTLDSEDFVEVKDERFKAGEEEGLLTGREKLQVLRYKVEHGYTFRDMDEDLAADLISEIDELYDEIQEQINRLTDTPG